MTGDLIGNERTAVTLPTLPVSQQRLNPALVDLPDLGDVYLHPE